ncbi:uncharacterized protein PV06_01894 [Exophiala oligosperma]|uniref:Extracellular membrane protein CFEM domain-containing protein n=1 Tax=Exophiala oligosperma TaxID=215243 RepID=A0A0D2B207_9EURO|nr:uncharacterized protein PV06_01894 [Exophiala oligosperma]KIW46211.1 hypothetical protein PV06_01894 [Exophiala oligosperma]
MKISAFFAVVVATLSTSVIAGEPGSHDANDMCYNTCEANKGIKNGMDIASPACAGLTGKMCEQSCWCDTTKSHPEGVMSCNNKKLPACSADTILKTCQAGLPSAWHCWCQGTWSDWGKDCDL